MVLPCAPSQRRHGTSLGAASEGCGSAADSSALEHEAAATWGSSGSLKEGDHLSGELKAWLFIISILKIIKV